MDHKNLISLYRERGEITLEDGNKRSITFLNPEKWSSEKGTQWIYLLFDLFQIRSVAPQFSEVSLDLIEYASKPTIYHTEPNFQTKQGPLLNGHIRFSLIKEPTWHKLLFQMAHPVLIQMDTTAQLDASEQILFPLFSPNLKELYLGPEGDIKIIKN
ncbi:hypothetical protein [Algoriphagus namhaensis]